MDVMEKNQIIIDTVADITSRTEEHNSLENQCLARGFRKIILYGYGVLGATIFRELRDSRDVNVVAIMDSFPEKVKGVPAGISIIGKDEKAPKNDGIIITAVGAFDVVKEELKKRGYTNVVNISDFRLPDDYLNIVEEFKERIYENQLDDKFSVIKKKSRIEVVVSVIIPVYNCDRYLTECIESVRKQTLKDIEIICVNDGSTDNSLNLLLEMAEQDSRIIVCTQDNRGQGHARNNGLKLAEGEFVYFCDADDYITETALYELYKKAIKDRADVVNFDIEPFYDGSKELKSVYDNYCRYYKRNRIYKNILTGKQFLFESIYNKDYLVSPCIKLIKRKFLTNNNIKFMDRVIYEDNEFNLQLMLKAKRVSYLHEICYKRRVRANSTVTSDKKFFHVYSCSKVVKKMQQLMEKECVDDETKEISFLIRTLTNDAIRYYGNLSLEEKCKLMSLSDEDRKLVIEILNGYYF